MEEEMSEEEIKKNALRSIKEFEMAWQEFFKDKPEPENDEEDKNQQEDFYNWYNNIRKQSDTGKTPAEMYEEIYGKVPPKNPNEQSRIINFDWDDEYNEDDYSEEGEIELDKAQEEASGVATEIFENSWKEIKREVEGTSKKEACRYSFILGFLNYMKIMDMQGKILEKEIKNMSKDDIEKIVNDFKDFGRRRENGD